MTKTYKVIVIDDHPLVRRGIVATFEEEADFQVVGEGGSAADALRLVAEKKPTLVMLDITMPGNGIDAAAQISKSHPGTSVVMLSIREELATVRSAFRAGAVGYISKGISGTELVNTARRIIAGERYVSPELAARLFAEEDTAVPNQSEGVKLRSPLTKREREIFELLGDGLSNQEIAERMGLSENTVKHYMTPLLHKLGVRNRTEAALLAKDYGSQKAPS